MAGNLGTEVKFRSSCDACLNTKVKCGQTKPSCARCIQHGYKCVYSQYRKIGRPSLKATAAAAAAAAVPLLAEQRPGEQQQKRLQQRTPRAESAAVEYRTPEKQRQELRTPETQPSTQHQHGQHQVSSDQECVHVSTDSHPDTQEVAPSPPAQTPEPTLGGNVNVGDLASLAGDSVMSMDVGAGLDYEMSTVDWAHLDNILDLSVTPSEEAHPTSQLQLDDIFALDPTNPSNISPTTSSYGDGRETPTVAPHHLSNHLSGTFGEDLFHSHPSRYYNPVTGTTVSPSESLSAEPQDVPRRPTTSNSTHLSRTNFFRSRESSLYSAAASGSRCVLQCHVDLTNQLAYISECQSHDNGAALDKLLKLDSCIREAREKILGCPACVGKGRCGQTLMLLTMVVSNLLGLFEDGCGTTGSPAAYTSRGSDNKSCRSSSSWRDSALGASSSSSSSVESPLSAVTSSSTSSPGCLPSTRRPLMVGDVQLSEEVKLAFCRRLLRIYLDRQIDTLDQLSQALAGAEVGDVNGKVTRELLEDVLRRAERFLGYITLTEIDTEPGGRAIFSSPIQA